MSISKEIKYRNLDENKTRIVINREVMKNTSIESLNIKLRSLNVNLSDIEGKIQKLKELHRKTLNTRDLTKFRIQDLEEK